MSPGPSLALVMRNTVNHGRAAGLVTAISHGVGVGIYALATALGLAAIIAAQQALFTTITLAGAGYLLWLGASAMRAASPDGLETPSDPAESAEPAAGNEGHGSRAAIRDGLAMALLNPKIAVFFLALFSQFVSADADAGTVAILAGTAATVDAAWYALVATGLAASGGAAWLRRRRVWIERLTGAVLVFLALSTAATVIG
ncbi:LysE family translocator [Spiribacter vilamensis]|nr:LysE family translocator [Spiribacter vilamensis]